MRLSCLKLSAALILSLTILPPLKASDHLGEDPETARIINKIVNYENSPDCHAFKPSPYESVYILNYILDQEPQWPSFTHLLNCLWNDTNPFEYNIPRLSKDQNKAFRSIAYKLIDRDGNLKDSIKLRSKHLKELPRLFGLFTNLTKLKIYGIHISHFGFLNNMTNLTKLNLRHNQMRSLSGLENLRSLSDMDLSYNHLNDLSFKSPLTSLMNLKVHDNRITNITGFENISNLMLLDLSNNNLSDLNGFSSLKRLIFINLRNNRIENIQTVEPLVNLNLTHLILIDNPAFEDEEKNQEVRNLFATIKVLYITQEEVLQDITLTGFSPKK